MFPIPERRMQGQRFAVRYGLRRWELLVCALLGTLIGAAVFFAAGVATALAAMFLVCTMSLVTLIDYRRFIIPDALSLPAVPLGLVAATSTLSGSTGTILADHLVAACAASSILYAVRFFYRRLRGVEGLGLGDVKLAAAAGAWVGLEALPITCLLATGGALAAVLSGSLLTRSARPGMMTAIPFGSFIAPSIVIVWLTSLLTS